MTHTTDLQKAQEILLRRRAALIGRHTQLTGERRDELERDRPSEMMESSAHDESLDFLELLAREEIRELEAIDEALESIEDGTYGICEICGEDIYYRRLEVLPTARCCVPCLEQRSSPTVPMYGRSPEALG